MKDVGKRQFVQRRGGILWARRKYPDDIVGKMVNDRKLGREFKKSLRVRDFKDVDKPLLNALSEFDRIVEAARSGGRMKAATPPTTERIVDYTLQTQSLSQIRDGDLVPLLTPWFVQQWGRSPEPAEAKAAEEIANECEIEASAYLNPSDTGAASAIQPLAMAELARLGYAPDRGHPRFFEAADLMARAKAAVLQRDASIIDPSRRANFRIDDPEVCQLVQAYEARSPRGRGGSRTFGDLLDYFMRDRATKPLSPGTRREDTVLHRVIKELVGADSRIEDVTPEHCMEIRDLFTRLPSNYTKHYRGRRLRDIPELAIRDRRPPMSRKTANKYIEFLAAVFKFGKRPLKWIGENPAEGLRLKIDQAEDKSYRPFTKKELSVLFEAPIFTGCKDSARGAFRPGKLVPRSSVRYWAPIIGLYSGMRANEICQLDADDIQHEVTGPVFVLRRSADKRLKTKSSRRKVPLHPELLRLGLVDLANDRTKAGDRKLFADAHPSKTGYFSDPFQKWFSPLLKHVGIKSKKNDRDPISFHSLRGTFKDALQNADVADPIIEALCGWGGPKTMIQLYGRGRTFEKFHHAVAQVNFGDVTAHLKPYISERSSSELRRAKKQPS